jgi:hypothetical protein
MSNYPLPGAATHLNGTAGTTLARWNTPGQTSLVIIQNRSSSESLEVFFTQKAADAGAGNGLTIPSGMGLEVAINIGCFWTIASAAGVSFEALFAVVP